ncbi:DUF1559 domain-containing protein [Rhodopirellula sp. MGV]|uniref:DUF1559 family PulG-like putative transporter n=1 Tax=Rhodopirellula sp. MGV TaxID=2023130 RepID=UPI000B973313|nr:DUF1559 domain-containing protein [Rhodopirellula sp. MGV]OYP34896.1 hypothetical protein CGZ80_12735 [Rhodopirellula sp. MGV]PNY38208.1 DUF1559 domain-containing protein [Rhodopirellula baltica]
MKYRFNGFDCIVLVVVALTLSSVLSMQLQRRRSAARREQCSDKLRELTIAAHAYHQVYRQFPSGAGGTDQGAARPAAGNDLRLSAFVTLLPFYDQQKTWDLITEPFQATSSRSNSETFPPMGPVPRFDPQIYTPWSMRPAMLVCPADRSGSQQLQAANYVMNYGDAVHLAGDLCGYAKSDFKQITATLATHRGVFARERVIRMRDVVDGTSNTLLFSEAKISGTQVAKDVAGLAANPSLALKQYSANQCWSGGRESVWCDGLLRSSGFQTILPPGSPSATSLSGELSAVMSASSYHPDGVYVAFVDGHVAFMSASVDAGESASPSVGPAGVSVDGQRLAPPGRPSPYGVWGALGTRNMREEISRREIIELSEVPRSTGLRIDVNPEPDDKKQTQTPSPMPSEMRTPEPKMAAAENADLGNTAPQRDDSAIETPSTAPLKQAPMQAADVIAVKPVPNSIALEAPMAVKPNVPVEPELSQTSETPSSMKPTPIESNVTRAVPTEPDAVPDPLMSVVEEAAEPNAAVSSEVKPIEATKPDAIAIENPLRKWSLADSAEPLIASLVSCDDRGNVVMKLATGETIERSLADFTSQDAYQIVASRTESMKRALEQARLADQQLAQSRLRPQLVEALKLLENKHFDHYLKRFYHPKLTSAERLRDLAERVSQRRGDFIQVLDDAIRSIDQGKIKTALDDDGVSLHLKTLSQGHPADLSMKYLDGAWYFTESD